MIKSCDNCTHWYVCKFKQEPYMGTTSGGIKFSISYEDFRTQLYALYGEYCSSYAVLGG